MTPTPCLILGAGLAGLSASVHLRRRGVPHRIVERNVVVGGHAVTVEEQGFRFDRTGHLLHLRDLQVAQDVTEWLGDALLGVQRRSVVWSHGAATRYPFQANLHGLPPAIAAECLLGYLRARDARRDAEAEATRRGAAIAAPETFEDLVLLHFGEGIARHFMVPYNEKLWGLHPRELSASWTRRFVPIPRLEDVVAGAVGAPAPELGYNAEFVYPRFGIGMLADALAERATVIETGRDVRAVEVARRRVELDGGESVRFETLVSTLPLPALVARIQDAPDEVRRAASRLRSTHLWYLDVALHGPCERDWHWCYVPDPAVPFYRVGSYSNFSAAMAPPGAGSLYVELASRSEPDLATLLPEVGRHLVAMGIVRSAERIRFARVRRIDPAYVVFDRDHAASVATVHAWLEENGVRSTGRYGAWTYGGMEDAIVQGRDAATWAVART